MAVLAVAHPYALNQYGFPANQIAVAVSDRVGALLMDYKNGNMGRLADLILGAMIGALVTFFFMSITFSSKLSSVETKLNMHLEHHNGHTPKAP